MTGGRAALAGMAIKGAPLRVRFQPKLTAWRGRLLESDERGQPVHAASFIRRRLIVLDAELRKRPRELERILAHELSHFAWMRLGNAVRRGWEDVLAREMSRGARGELGWSAELRKEKLAPEDWRRRTRRWREYACESFSDTVAWLRVERRAHDEFTLAARFRVMRKRWFAAHLGGRTIPI
ncbi:MAG: hypothetical protein LLG20_08855 [Acidobacteriales bacterium]|nr:hypothetical protein [Terriglobales bacterium]